MNSSLSSDTVIRHARALSSRIVDLAGADSIRAIFAGGSVATGNIAAVEVDGVVEVLSDIDLYVVVSESANEAEVRQVARTAADDVGAEPGIRYVREHDIGVYTEDDLRAQPLRPGTVNLARQHVLLYGDAGVFEGLQGQSERDIAAQEALYLIENRLTELFALDRGGDNACDARLRRFYALKICLDVASAELVGQGRYTPSLDMRLERLRGLNGEQKVPDDALDLYEAAWTRWRDLEPHVLGETEDTLRECEVVAAAVGAWRRIASRSIPDSDGSWASLLDHRCHFGDHVHNYRQLLTLCKRQGRRRRDVAWAGIHAARFAPLDALRTAALVHFVQETEAEHAQREDWVVRFEMYLDRLTSLCGHVTGGITERAVEMCRALR